jgi:hypothetical protein
MKKTSTYLISLLATLTISACAHDAGPDDTYSGSIKQESAFALSDAVACDALTPCENGLECLWINAANLDTPICIDAANACELLDCGGGECLILESYPGQVVCSGNGGSGGGGGDEPVCDTPDGTCNPGVPTEPDCSEPGDHGGGSEPGDPGDGPDVEPVDA